MGAFGRNHDKFRQKVFKDTGSVHCCTDSNTRGIFPRFQEPRHSTNTDMQPDSLVYGCSSGFFDGYLDFGFHIRDACFFLLRFACVHVVSLNCYLRKNLIEKMSVAADKYENSNFERSGDAAFSSRMPTPSKFVDHGGYDKQQQSVSESTYPGSRISTVGPTTISQSSSYGQVVTSGHHGSQVHYVSQPHHSTMNTVTTTSYPQQQYHHHQQQQQQTYSSQYPSQMVVGSTSSYPHITSNVGMHTVGSTTMNNIISSGGANASYQVRQQQQHSSSTGQHYLSQQQQQQQYYKGANMMTSSAATTTIGNVSYGEERVIKGEERIVSVNTIVGEERIVKEDFVIHQVMVPKRVVTEEVIEKVIIVPETIRKEEVIEEAHMIEEKVVHLARQIIEERVIEVPETVIVDKIIEEIQVQYVDKIREVSVPQIVEVVKEQVKIIEVEKVVEVPVIDYVEKLVEKYVEEIEYVEDVRIREVPVPQYVEKPVPNYVTKEVSVDIERNLPIPVEAVTTFQYKLATFKPRVCRVQYPMYIPRFIEVPVAAELYEEMKLSMFDAQLQRLSMLKQSTVLGMCEVESMAKEFQASESQDIITTRSGAQFEAAISEAWRTARINLINKNSTSHVVSTSSYQQQQHHQVMSNTVSSGYKQQASTNNNYSRTSYQA